MNATTPGDPIAGPAGRGLDCSPTTTNGGDATSTTGPPVKTVAETVELQAHNSLPRNPAPGHSVSGQGFGKLDFPADHGSESCDLHSDDWLRRKGPF
jgi:hypothetical protein